MILKIRQIRKQHFSNNNILCCEQIVLKKYIFISFRDFDVLFLLIWRACSKVALPRLYSLAPGNTTLFTTIYQHKEATKNFTNFSDCCRTHSVRMSYLLGSDSQISAQSSFYLHLRYLRSRHTVVSMVTRLFIGRSGVLILTGARARVFFSSSKRPEQTAIYSTCTGILSPGI
jgi:hypothetical protein